MGPFDGIIVIVSYSYIFVCNVSLVDYDRAYEINVEHVCEHNCEHATNIFTSMISTRPTNATSSLRVANMFVVKMFVNMSVIMLVSPAKS